MIIFYSPIKKMLGWCNFSSMDFLQIKNPWTIKLYKFFIYMTLSRKLYIIDSEMGNKGQSVRIKPELRIMRLIFPTRGLEQYVVDP